MNDVYTDLETAAKKLPDKAKDYIKYLETNCWFSNGDVSDVEVLSITTAIRATQMAELEALLWSQTVKPVEVEYRIKELKKLT